MDDLDKPTPEAEIKQMAQHLLTTNSKFGAARIEFDAWRTVKILSFKDWSVYPYTDENGDTIYCIVRKNLMSQFKSIKELLISMKEAKNNETEPQTS